MNKQITDIIALIKKHEKIALFHHMMIDGDSLSSSYGLLKAIKGKFPNKEVVFVAEKETIQKRFPYLDIDFSVFRTNIDDSYLGIVGDVANIERIEHNEELKKLKTRICFDHHRNEIDFKADVFWHEPHWPASALQAVFIAEALGVAFDEEIAINLLYGVITDTGRFQYSAANPLPLEVAARLMKYIENETISHLYEQMGKRDMDSLRLDAAFYEKLKIEGGLGYVIMTKKDQEALGMDAQRVARVNIIANIEGEKVWMLFTEYPDFIRVEYRSHGIPVNEIASHFGGGGHIKAAGCKLESLDQIDEVIRYTKEFIKNSK